MPALPRTTAPHGLSQGSATGAQIRDGGETGPSLDAIESPAPAEPSLAIGTTGHPSFATFPARDLDPHAPLAVAAGRTRHRMRSLAARSPNDLAPMQSILRGAKATFTDMKNEVVHHPFASASLFAAITAGCYGLSKSPYPVLACLVPGVAFGISIVQIARGIDRVRTARSEHHPVAEAFGWEGVGRGLASLGVSATGAGAAKLLPSWKAASSLAYLDDAPSLLAATKTVPASSKGALPQATTHRSGSDEQASEPRRR